MLEGGELKEVERCARTSRVERDVGCLGSELVNVRTAIHVRSQKGNGTLHSLLCATERSKRSQLAYGVSGRMPQDRLLGAFVGRTTFRG